MADVKEMEAFYNSSDAYEFMLETHEGDYIPKFAEFVIRTVKPHAKVLDVGCGIGRSTNLLAKKYDAIGMDFSKKFIGYAKKQYKDVRFICGSALDMPFESNKFDAVVSYAVVEHMTDIPRFLDECLRVLRPGGTLIVGGPNLTSPLRPLRCILSAKGFEGFTSSRFASIKWLFSSTFYSLTKWLSVKPDFVYRTPHLDIKDHLGPDADATYVSSMYDIRNYLQGRNVSIKRLSPTTFNWNRIPIFAPHIGVVGIKNEGLKPRGKPSQ